MTKENVFVQRETLTVIDTMRPDGTSFYEGETLEQIQQRYPGASVADLDEFIAYKEKQLCTDPQEMDEEKFMYYLEVLPPQNWQRGKGYDVFELSEYTSGRVTQICVRLGKRYFGFNGLAWQTASANVLRVQQAFGFNN